MAIKDGNGLAYKSDVLTWSVYELHVSGVVVLEVAIDNADPELKIFIGKQGATFAQVQVGVPDQLTETKGRAIQNVYAVGDGEGAVPEGLSKHVSGTSVQTYIYPRALRFVVQLYVVKPMEAPAS